MGATYNIWVVEENIGNAEEGLEEAEFSEEKTLPEVHGGTRWPDDESGGSDQNFDEESDAGSEDLEVEEEASDGTHYLEPTALVDLGENLGKGDWQLVGMQEDRLQLEARLSEEW